MASVLYEVQIIEGESYLAQSTRKIASVETVEAARGEILDRYGRVLVSNRTIYQVSLDLGLMDDNHAEILSRLIEISEEEGIDWKDSLPISNTAPYVFTSSTPFYTTSTDDDGVTTRNLTRLGKLSVKMNWLEENPSKKEFYDIALPSAEELLYKMCLSFDLLEDDKPLPKNSHSLRQITGVMYDLYLRKKDIYWEPYFFAEDVHINFITRVKEEGLRGVIVEPSTVRQYNTEYAAHVLGRVALMDSREWEHYKSLDSGYEMDDSVGKDGAEKAFESYLRGTSGLRTVDRNTAGKIVSETWITPPEPGENVTLTLDIDLQKKVEDTLRDYLPQLDSEEVKGAACVILDVNSGGALALASYPTFQLDRFSADYTENLENPLNPMFNRATMGLYAPGSTFKMVSAIAALEEGIVTPETEIKDLGVYKYYTNKGPMCWIYRQYGGSHGNQNVSEAIKNSCNYYFYEIGRLLGIEAIEQYAAMFGLGQTTGIELPESSGVMAGPAFTESMGGTWYDGSTLSVVIGQESSQFTPIQIANYIATLVNGGTHYSTHILKEVRSNDFSEIVYTQPPTVVDVIEIETQNLEAVKVGMLELTQTGSVSSYFRNFDVKVGAKTGSSQVTGSNESNAVFVAFAPYDNPEIALALVVEGGGGGSDLGLLVSEIIEYYFSAEENREQINLEGTLIQ